MSHPAPPADGEYFTAAQVAEQVEAARRAALETARTEEREKLYGKIRQTDDRYKEMDAEVKRLTDLEAQRVKDDAKRQAEVEKAKQKAAEAELSAKDLLEKRQQEWEDQRARDRAEQDSKLAEIVRQRELDQAVMAKEREMAALQLYIRDQVEAERDNIAPELLAYIGGDTQEQVDASIARVKETTAAIIEGMRQAQVQHRAGMPGVAPSGGATAITPGLDTGQQQITAEDINKMSMKEFAALRVKAGMQGNGQGRGIFG